MLMVAWMAFLRFYAPAFLDYDLFFQRIVVENGYLVIRLLGSVPLILSGLCLLSFLTVLLVRRVWPARATHWLAWAPWLMFGISVSALYLVESQRRSRILDAAERQLSPAVLGVFRAEAQKLSLEEKEYVNLWKEERLSVQFRKAYVDQFASVQTPAGTHLNLLIPVANGRFLFLWHNEQFDYVDLRPLSSNGSQLMGYDLIQQVLGDRTRVATRFLEFAGSVIYSLSWGDSASAMPIPQGEEETPVVLIVRAARAGGERGVDADRSIYERLEFARGAK